MIYMGSKARHAKEILSVIAPYRKHGQAWVEPFVGGANMIKNVDAPIRIGGDFNEYVISLYQALQDGWHPPEYMTDEVYKEVKNNKESYPSHLVGLLGFTWSFGGKWFGGFVGNSEPKEIRVERAVRSSKRIKDEVNGVIMVHASYDELPIPDDSLIYCDPPYEGTTKYRDDFNHAKFWQWCRDMSDAGHTVFISEYNAPGDFVAIWEKTVKTTIATSKKATEKLFVYIPQLLRDGYHV